MPAACTFLGLVIAVLTDKIWWGTIAKSLIFLPLAISFVGASVIWKFVYEYRGEGQVQIGLARDLHDQIAALEMQKHPVEEIALHRADDASVCSRASQRF